MKKAIFFDFDGVICDSMRECYLTSNAAYEEYTQERPKSSFKEFKRYRKYVAPPGEYYVIQRIMNKKERCKNYGEFRSLAGKYSSECAEFRDHFFRAREELIAADKMRWLKLHSFYRKAVALIKGHRFTAYIITTKNADAVDALIRYAGIRDNVSGICSTRPGESKKDIVSRMLKAKTVESAMFIDDHPKEVEEVSGIRNVKSYLAKWGYWGGCAREFRNSSIRILSLNNLSKTALSFLGEG